MNPLPPQAYTKETLLKAYSWVMNQSASIKDMATTPDILVSLYLKATRDGESALDRPSIQNFKKELKSLAGMMGELDRVPAANTGTSTGAAANSAPIVNQAPPTNSQQNHSSAQAPHPGYQEKAEPFVSMPASATMPNIQAETKNEARHENRSENRTDNRTDAKADLKSDLKSQLDPLSLAMIHEVKLALNLSSDVEALRMLIKIGYTRSQGLLK